MLGILLFILKIIGIIILSILGLVLFLLLIILFVPIRYNAEISVLEKKPSGKAGISWLCRLIQIQFSFGNENAGLLIRIAGKVLGRKKRKPVTGPSDRSTPKKRQKKSEKKSKQETKEPNLLEDAVSTEDATIVQNEKDHNLLEKTTETVRESLPETQPELEKEAEVPKQTLDETLDKIRNTIDNKINGIYEKRNGLNEKRLWVASLLEYLQSDPMKGSLGKLKLTLIKILLHILPRKGKLNLKIGFNNPATTGQVLSILAMLYPRFSGNLSVTPYFDRFILEGDFSCKGRIQLIVFVAAAIKVVLDKNIRTFVKKVRNGGK